MILNVSLFCVILGLSAAECFQDDMQISPSVHAALPV